MEKKLPKVFVNQIDKRIHNNETVFYSKGDSKEVLEPMMRSFQSSGIKNDMGLNINQKINRIFQSPRYVYKADVKITLKDKTVLKRIVGKSGDYLITIENELLPIADILDIEFA